MIDTKEKARPAANRGGQDKSLTNDRHSIENLLARLDKVRRTGGDTWQACCPAHDDRGPSLSIRATDDGRILLHCFAGCDVQDVIGAVGLTISDLFPPRPLDHLVKPERRPFPAADVLRAVGFEALVVSAAAVAMLAGQPFTELDRDRLILAASRIQAALTAAGVAHG
jgi:hypothetical protein